MTEKKPTAIYYIVGTRPGYWKCLVRDTSMLKPCYLTEIPSDNQLDNFVYAEDDGRFKETLAEFLPDGDGFFSRGEGVDFEDLIDCANRFFLNRVRDSKDGVPDALECGGEAVFGEWRLPAGEV